MNVPAKLKCPRCDWWIPMVNRIMLNSDGSFFIPYPLWDEDWRFKDHVKMCHSDIDGIINPEIIKANYEEIRS